MALLALFAAAQASGFSVLQSSFIGSALFFAAALSAIWKGKVVDNKGRAVVVRQAQILAIIYIALLAAFLWGSWWVVAFGAFLLGLARCSPDALQQALWSEVHSNRSLLARAMAWEGSVAFAAQISGPLMTILAIWLFGEYGALAVAATLTVLSMGTWGKLAPRNQKALSPTKGLLFSTEGLMLSALPIIASLFIFSFSGGLLQGILLNSENGALLIAIYILGAALTGLYFFRKALPLEGLRVAMSISPLLLFAPALFWNTALLFPSLLLGGALFSVGVLAAKMKIKERSPNDRLNEAFSLPLVAGPLGVSLGVLASGFLVSFSWQPVAIVVSLSLVLLVSILVWKEYLPAARVSEL